jgi:hypothetical protein
MEHTHIPMDDTGIPITMRYWDDEGNCIDHSLYEPPSSFHRPIDPSKADHLLAPHAQGIPMAYTSSDHGTSSAGDVFTADEQGDSYELDPFLASFGRLENGSILSNLNQTGSWMRKYMPLSITFDDNV